MWYELPGVVDTLYHYTHPNGTVFRVTGQGEGRRGHAETGRRTDEVWDALKSGVFDMSLGTHSREQLTNTENPRHIDTFRMSHQGEMYS